MSCTCILCQRHKRYNQKPLFQEENVVTFIIYHYLLQILKKLDFDFKNYDFGQYFSEYKTSYRLFFNVFFLNFFNHNHRIFNVGIVMLYFCWIKFSFEFQI